MKIERSKLHTFFLMAVAILICDQVGSVYLRSSSSSSPSGSLALNYVPGLRPDGQFQVATVKELSRVFKDFDLAETQSVPRLYLAKLPKNMKTARRSPKKEMFIQAVLPHILQVNTEILADRSKLLELQKKQMGGKRLSPGDKLWLSKLGSHYRCSSKIRTLLKHVDAVPPSLALAQGALESGWGTSHAATVKNSTFGHMRTKKSVESFQTLLHNVTAYIHNLNRHVAYAKFRSQRESLRQKGNTLCGYTLAPNLTKYSVRGAAYTRDLQKMITRHALKKYDKASLVSDSF